MTVSDETIMVNRWIAVGVHRLAVSLYFLTFFGLLSIRERLDRLGGRLDLITHPGKGTYAAVEAPGQWTMRSGAN